MLSDYASSLKNQMRAGVVRTARVVMRRTAHGGTAWGARPDSDTEMYQPQDGGIDLDARSRVTEISAQLNRTSFIEPEDARITGTTRSLMRRLMGLNVGRKTPQTVAPQHSLMVRKEVQVA
jgi:hypothetical protein